MLHDFFFIRFSTFWIACRLRDLMRICPPIFNVVGDIVFQFGKGYKHYHLENNRRAKCEKLKKLLLILRKIIENNAMVGIGEITRWIEKNVDIIEKEKINYKPADMILSRTHKANKYYDDTYGDLEKYYITEKHYNLATDKGAEIIGGVCVRVCVYVSVCVCVGPGPK